MTYQTIAIVKPKQAAKGAQIEVFRGQHTFSTHVRRSSRVKRPTVKVFANEQQMRGYVTSLVSAWAKSKAEKAERAKPIDAKVGDILVASWGYNQTNVDFYEVVGRRGKCTVDLQPLSNVAVDAQSDRVVPGEACGDVIKGKRLNSYGVKVDSSRRASPWNGNGMFETPWGCGH